jgi:hypothetical protein
MTRLLFLLVPFALANGLDQAGLGVETERRTEDYAAPVEIVRGIDTVRLLADTEAPTESPAPSPSPSASPTQRPTVTSKPTAQPTGAPTESPAPSPSPSAAPTNFPTNEPSASPTNFPTVTPMPSEAPTESMQPSLNPSQAPTKKPSSTPSYSPSNSPTISPSAEPSPSPSVTPTAAPSATPTTGEPSSKPTGVPTGMPSGAPSPAPTAEGVKTKIATSLILLEALDEKMMDDEIGRFEIRTLEFIKEAFPKANITDFEINIIAGTVLTQNLHDGSNGGKNRKLETHIGLEVLFRTVGVVTNGVASEGFDFQDLVDGIFEAHFDIYLNELSAESPFFAPLFVGTKAEKGSSTQFIIALIVSAVAFLIAIGSSHYAIRKHLESKNRKKRHPMLALTDGKYATDSSSSDGSDKDNTNSNLRLVIDDDDELNDVNLSPALMSAMSSVMSRSDESRPWTNKPSPLSPNTLEKGGARPPLDDLYREAPPSKKWLTPRNFFKSALDTSSSPGGRSDPPENPDDLKFLAGGRKSFSKEPSARKAATTEQPGRLSDANKVKLVDCCVSFESIFPFAITYQLAIFIPPQNHSKPPRRPSSVATPLGSTVSSFFAKAGSAFGRGKKNATSDAGVSEPGPSQVGDNDVRPTLSKHHSQGIPQKNTILAYYRDGSEAGQSDFSRAKESDYYNPSEHMGSEAQTDYDVNYSEAGYDVNPSEAGYSECSEYTENDRTRSSRKNSLDEQDDRSRSNHKKRFDDTISLDEQSEDRERNKRSKSQDQEWWNDDRDVQPKRETIGGNGGARPVPVSSQERNNDKESFFNSGMNIPSRAPSSVGARSSQPSPASSVYHQYPTLPTQQQDTTRRAFDYDRGGNAFSLGARPLEATEVKQFKEKSSLETMAKRAGVYDVFAPSGPIGIVVDTSKEGPAVHSLKSTSPMLGLISPGDLIIALDDEDTRDMTAASLTRLMAKKSRAKERKITLLAIENF